MRGSRSKRGGRTAFPFLDPITNKQQAEDKQPTKDEDKPVRQKMTHE